MTAFAAPLAVPSATAPPIRIIVSPPPSSVVRCSPVSSSATASSGITAPSFSMIVSTAAALAKMLKNPTEISRSAGIARNA